MDVLVLQHPNERGKYYGTLKLLSALAKNVTVLRGVLFERNQILDAIGDRTPFILFPGPQAVSPQALTLTGKEILIVIDGTWSEAGKIFRRNECLSHFQSLKIEAQQSEYKIRKQPKPGCLSTIEATLAALEALPQESAQGLQACQALRGAFRTMVEQQLLFWPRTQLTF